MKTYEINSFVSIYWEQTRVIYKLISKCVESYIRHFKEKFKTTERLIIFEMKNLLARFVTDVNPTSSLKY